MKAIDTIQDLIEEAKLRTLWWALCVFLLTYFLSHTSSSMWMNLPLSIAFLAALRILSNEVEFSWKSRKPVQVQSYLSHLEKKQLSPNDSRLYATPPPPRWKRKIDSPIVEAAANEFIDKILKDFVIDLWYSEITPDKEVPELIRAVIMDAIGEIAGRFKLLNLVDLLTRDTVDLIGDHIELFRRNQLAIGADVMGTLSTEERDDRLKHHLMSSKELHPALISPESEYKYLQRLIGGLLAVLLRPRESQCPLVRAIAREIVTCLVMQPVMNLASPGYINELIEFILLAINDGTLMEVGSSQFSGGVHKGDKTPSNCSSLSRQKAEDYNAKGKYQNIDLTLAKIEDHMDQRFDYDSFQPKTVQPCPADWARMLEVATQRRTEVLMPENLENMWTKGRNYKKKENKNIKSRAQQSAAKVAATNNIVLPKETLSNNTISTKGTEEKVLVQQEHQLAHDIRTNEEKKHFGQFMQDLDKQLYFDGEQKSSDLFVNENRNRLKRSNSTSALKIQPDKKLAAAGDSEGPVISEFYGPEFGRHGDNHLTKVSDIILRNDGSNVPKLRCRVMGAYFEKLGSKSFAVYSIAVTDAENRTWFVKRRYRNFERLHRYLKEIPNYTLHLPPKRIFSSSTEDAFVHQRCIQLDKYLQDLLSIANVAEQHEVWDFLSASSKNYSFGKSSSVMRNLAVNVDDAVDDIVRQFKGVFSSSSPLDGSASSANSRHLSWNADEMHSHLRQDTSETLNSLSDNEESHQEEIDDRGEVGISVQGKGWHSDNELESKGFAPLLVKQDGGSGTVGSQKKIDLEVKSEKLNQVTLPTASSLGTYNSKLMEDPSGMPPEWTPSNVSVPLLNLVDKVFQLKKRGWLRRQVFWMSKQILQLIMEDAIDDWLLSKICWLRSEETVAQGIQWVQDVLWPNGLFFTRIAAAQNKGDDAPDAVPFQINQFGGMGAPKQGSFEEQLAATRRASDIKKMLFDGAPTALVSLIGNKQYKRCARDIFYFTQSTICVKQLAYAILELVIVSVFPELRDVVLDINNKMRASPQQ